MKIRINIALFGRRFTNLETQIETSRVNYSNLFSSIKLTDGDQRIKRSFEQHQLLDLAKRISVPRLDRFYFAFQGEKGKRSNREMRKLWLLF